MRKMKNNDVNAVSLEALHTHTHTHTHTGSLVKKRGEDNV